MLKIEWTDDLTGLLSDKVTWDKLSRGVPFRDSAWLSAWWKHLGAERTPLVLVARDADGILRGVLPLYHTPVNHKNASSKTLDATSRVLHNLADGNACSDHVSILASPEDQEAVAKQMADYLVDVCADHQLGWHSIVIDGVVEDDVAMEAFTRRLATQNVQVHCHSKMSTWYCRCDDNWEAFLQQSSRNSRGKKRRILKNLTVIPGLSVEVAQSAEQVDRMLDELIRIHQERWSDAGESGSFIDPDFRDFIHAAADTFFAEQRLWLVAIRLDQSVICSALAFIGNDNRAYGYTTGNDLKHRKLEPGKLLALHMIQQAHERGLAGIDFMRGDEPYKANLNAEAKRLMEVRIASPLVKSRLHHAAWLTQFEVKQFFRRRLGRKPIDVVDFASPA